MAVSKGRMELMLRMRLQFVFWCVAHFLNIRFKHLQSTFESERYMLPGLFFFNQSLALIAYRWLIQMSTDEPYIWSFECICKCVRQRSECSQWFEMFFKITLEKEPGIIDDYLLKFNFLKLINNTSWYGYSSAQEVHKPILEMHCCILSVLLLCKITAGNEIMLILMFRIKSLGC